MMKLNVTHLCLSTLLTTVLINNFDQQAFAASFKIMGTFDDATTFSGSFNFDETNTTTPYTNVNITTLAGNLSGASYVDPFGDFYLSAANSNSFVISSSNPMFEFDLMIDFDGTLTENTTQLSLSTNSFEEDLFSFDTRNVTFGEVEKVPEPSTLLGTTIVLGLGTLFKQRKQKQ